MTRLSRSLLLALMFAACLPVHAAKTVAGSDGFPEPRVVTTDMNLPEQIMSIQEQAAIQNKRNQPRRDKSGRIQYMVDLAQNVTDGHSATLQWINAWVIGINPRCIA